jgi:hypothetical protein
MCALNLTQFYRYDKNRDTSSFFPKADDSVQRDRRQIQKPIARRGFQLRRNALAKRNVQRQLMAYSCGS